jgi:hypothetical protein
VSFAAHHASRELNLPPNGEELSCGPPAMTARHTANDTVGKRAMAGVRRTPNETTLRDATAARERKRWVGPPGRPRR